MKKNASPGPNKLSTTVEKNLKPCRERKWARYLAWQ